MLHHLCELSEQENLVDDPAFEWQPVAWTIFLNTNGELMGNAFVSNHYALPLREGSRAKPKEAVKRIRVPRQFNPETGGRRTSGDFAYFLVDKSDYSLGFVPGSAAGQPQNDAKLCNRQALFLEKIVACHAATGSDALAAVIKFLTAVKERGLPIELPHKCLPNELFCFRVGMAESLVHEELAIEEYWRNLCRPEQSGVTPLNCVITGVPIERSGLFPTVKRIPGGAMAGAGLVSFNADSFESYGWKKNENAPVDATAAIKAATALTRLVTPGFVNAIGEQLPSRSFLIAKDTVFAYWSTAPDHGNALRPLIDSSFESTDAASIGEVCKAVYRGQKPPAVNTAMFRGIMLTGAQGRIILRQTIDATLETVFRNIQEHSERVDCVRLAPDLKKGKTPPVHGIQGILDASTGPYEKAPPPIAVAFVRAAFLNLPYPTTLLLRCLARERAEFHDNSWTAACRRDSRVAFYKAYLCKGNSFDSSPLANMDPNNRELPYLYGRLLACYAEMQRLAHYPRTVNAGVAEKYFTAFGVNPAVILKNLEDRYRHNHKKARRNQAAAWVIPQATHVDQNVQRIFAAKPAGRPDAPFTPEEQALFVIGFQHQRHWFSLKREEKGEYLRFHQFNPEDPHLTVPSTLDGQPVNSAQ